MIEGLDEEQRQIVSAILRRHAPERAVWAFGSRVNGRAKPYSDLDLVILGDEPLAPQAMALLREACSDSPLPFKIDLAEWATLGDTFRKIILDRYEVLLEPDPGAR